MLIYVAARMVADDPDVIKAAKAVTGQWKLAFLKFDREAGRRDDSTAKNLGHVVKGALHEEGNFKKHGALVAIDVLLDLQLSLRCDSWIGTLKSNLSRLMDELRSVIARKATSGEYVNMNGDYDLGY